MSHTPFTRNHFSASSSGRRSQVLELAKAGICYRSCRDFSRVYPFPDNAPCDGPSAIALDKLEVFLTQLKEIDDLIKRQQNI